VYLKTEIKQERNRFVLNNFNFDIHSKLIHLICLYGTISLRKYIHVSVIAKRIIPLKYQTDSSDLRFSITPINIIKTLGNYRFHSNGFYSKTNIKPIHYIL